MGSKGGITLNRRTLAAIVAPTARTTLKLGAELVTRVRDRVFPSTGAGRDENDQAFSGYATKRLYVSKASPPRPADMPAPKGLTEAGLRRAKPGTAERRGTTRRDRKTVRFDGGYRQYRLSTGRSAEKNLTMSGQTARALGVTRAGVREIVLGFRTRKDRAAMLDASYDFMGLTPDEFTWAADRLRELVTAQIDAELS